jgi:putative DNA primase/helicase
MSLLDDDLDIGGDTAITRRLDTVMPEAVQWLWPGRIPRGKLTLVIGDPGLGKSFLMLDAMARVTRGARWADGAPAPVGDCILMSAEDGLADTIRPRLDALDADICRVHALTAVRDEDGALERGFSLERDLHHLEDVIKKTSAILVGIDPLSAYLGSKDSYKDSEIRGLLGPLAALAERTGVAIVAIIHLTKDQQRRALYRALGSIAFVAAARAVLAVGKDPEDEDRRILVTVKNNLAAPAPALAFTLRRGTLDWYAGTVEGVDADAVLSPASEERGERQDANDFLRELLADGEVASKDIMKAAEANGVSRATLFRSKRQLGIVARRVGFGKQGTWYWSLPLESQEQPKESHTAGNETLWTSQQENSRNGAQLSKESHSAGSETLCAGSETLSPVYHAVPRRSSLPPKTWP